MAEQPRKTITCPRCSNVNPYDEDDCLKCDLPLDEIGGMPSCSTLSATPSRP